MFVTSLYVMKTNPRFALKQSKGERAQGRDKGEGICPALPLVVLRPVLWEISRLGMWSEGLLHPSLLLSPPGHQVRAGPCLHEQDTCTCLDWCISNAAIPEKGRCLKVQHTKLVLRKPPNRARTIRSSFPTQIWAACDLDSNLGSVSVFREEVGMMVVVHNNNLNRTASVIPLCRRATEAQRGEFTFLAGHPAGL